MTVESRVVDHWASWGPTGLEAVAVAAPTHRQAGQVTASSTDARTTLRKRTVRPVHHREQAARARAAGALTASTADRHARAAVIGLA